MSEIRSGGGYLSQSDLRLHFGVGQAKTIDKVEVRWQAGSTQVFENVSVDRFYKLKQGGQLLPINYRDQPTSGSQAVNH
jgi:hypothetical protein